MPPTPVRLKNLWPIPALALAMGMFGAGLYVAVKSRPKPPPGIPLEQAKALVQDGEFDRAIEMLASKEVRQFLDYGDEAGGEGATKQHRQAFHLARARAFAGAQGSHGLSIPANHRSIVDDFTRAEELGVELEGADAGMLASSLIALDRVDEAMTRIDALPEAERPRKTRLTRLVVEHNLDAPEGSAGGARRQELTLELLARLAGDPSLTPQDRAWVLARQAELLIASGPAGAEEAAGKLVRRIGLLKDVPADLQGELYLLLGRAYLRADQPQAALKQLEYADGVLDRTSPLRSDLNVLLGRLAQSGVVSVAAGAPAVTDTARTLEAARERFDAVLADNARGRALAMATLGLAEVEASLRNDAASLERYAQLTELLRNAGPGARATGDVTRETVLGSLVRRAQERADAGQHESALRFAQQAELLFDDASTPPEVLLAIGASRRALADGLLAPGAGGGAEGGADAATPAPADGGAGAVGALDASTKAEAKRNYMIAGEYLRRHARAVIANDPGAAAQSLWAAADSFDRAGDLDEAQKAFADYADGASDSDPQRPAARFRLARVLQAKREHGAAAAIYRALASSRDASRPADTAGVWADAAIVPLAQCLLSDPDPSNDAEAERLLLAVVDGNAVAPDAPAFRDALVELGSMYSRAGRYGDAVGWLEQADKRARAGGASDPRAEGVRAMLADAHRLEAVAIARTLASQRLPRSQADELEASRAGHLRAARGLFEGLVRAYDARGARSLTELERVRLRNAHFAIGDCAMEMRDYAGAVAAYDAARLRYADDPASLVAMAQIVSAYLGMGRPDLARTANDRARQQLARYPESVWQSPDLPMEKRHWERWLDARTVLEQQRTDADASGAGGAGGTGGRRE